MWRNIFILISIKNSLQRFMRGKSSIDVYFERKNLQQKTLWLHMHGCSIHLKQILRKQRWDFLFIWWNNFLPFDCALLRIFLICSILYDFAYIFYWNLLQVSDANIVNEKKKRYECIHCQRTFKYQGFLKSHVKKFHSGGINQI